VFLLLPCKFFKDDKYFFYGIIDFFASYWSGKMLLREESEFVDVGRVGAGNNIKLARFLPSSSFFLYLYLLKSSSIFQIQRMECMRSNAIALSLEMVMVEKKRACNFL
jgi:hypothetical protein